MNYAYLTQTTHDMLDGVSPPRRNMTNNKPFRTPSQKRLARETTHKSNDGAYRSSAPVSHHNPVKL
jgi:hypothetical protein